jgi:hypothetical protein
VPRPDGSRPLDPGQIAVWVAVGLAFFTILFGTRNLDAREQHHGIVTAIAVEAVVKLVALLAVGSFVVWGIAGGVADVIARIDAGRPCPPGRCSPGRWTGIIFLSAAAVICLPRMFQVMVVENEDEGHLARASWAFPLYLFGDEPVHRAHRRGGAGADADGRQPRHVRPDPAAGRGAGQPWRCWPSLAAFPRPPRW